MEYKFSYEYKKKESEKPKKKKTKTLMSNLMHSILFVIEKVYTDRGLMKGTSHWASVK